MKVKLLKRIRKEFHIVFYPHGETINNKVPVFIVFRDDYDVLERFKVKNENNIKKYEDKARTFLIEYIVREFSKYGKRRIKKHKESAKNIFI